MSDKVRLDLALLKRGLAQSRTHAQELIEAGQVYLIYGGQKKLLKKASVDIGPQEILEVEKGPANRYVSRGGLKLEGALAQLQKSAYGLKVLDVGISTGGFSDYLLQNGAEFVLGVDVGHGQVHANLLLNPKLKVIEGVNARALQSEQMVLAATPLEKFDLIVMDVSFISIELILPQLSYFLKSGGYVLSLVKPQFEVGKDGLAKGGIVKDPALYQIVEDRIKTLCQNLHLHVVDYFSSSIQGKDGNHEFFVYAKKD